MKKVFVLVFCLMLMPIVVSASAPDLTEYFAAYNLGKAGSTRGQTAYQL